MILTFTRDHRVAFEVLAVFVNMAVRDSYFLLGVPRIQLVVFELEKCI